MRFAGLFIQVLYDRSLTLPIKVGLSVNIVIRTTAAFDLRGYGDSFVFPMCSISDTPVSGLYSILGPGSTTEFLVQCEEGTPDNLTLAGTYSHVLVSNIHYSHEVPIKSQNVKHETFREAYLQVLFDDNSFSHGSSTKLGKKYAVSPVSVLTPNLRAFKSAREIDGPPNETCSEAEASIWGGIG